MTEREKERKREREKERKGEREKGRKGEREKDHVRLSRMRVLLVVLRLRRAKVDMSIGAVSLVMSLLLNR